MKIEYVCHPVAGNVEQNVAEIRQVLRERHNKYRLPFAPYLLALQYLRDDIPEERELGMQANEEFFKAGTIHSVYVCGNRISNGMRREILLAYAHSIPLEVEPQLMQDVERILPFHMSYIGQRDLANGNSVIAVIGMLSGDLVAYEAADSPRNKEDYDSGKRGAPLWYDELAGWDWSEFRHCGHDLLDKIAASWGAYPIRRALSVG